MENYSLSDIAAATGEGGGMCNSWVLIILFALIFGNGFGGLGGGLGQAATQADVQRAVDLNSIQRGQSDIASDVQRTAYETMAVNKDAAYNNLSEIRDVQSEVTNGFANQQRCCCDTLRAIDSVNYNGAINTASINANTTAAMQKVLDKMAADKEQSLYARINQLEMANQMAGVVRYPMSSSWALPGNPFCGSGCGSNI